MPTHLEFRTLKVSGANHLAYKGVHSILREKIPHASDATSTLAERNG